MIFSISYIAQRLMPFVPIIIGFSLYLFIAIAATVVSQSPTVGAAVANGLILVAVVLWRRFKPEHSVIINPRGAQLSSRSFWLITGIALILCWITGQTTAAWAYESFGSASYDQSVQIQTETSLVLMLALALVFAPIGEEALMRGIAYPMMRRLFPPVAAALITSTVFAMIHGNLVQIAVALPLGVLLAFVYERTQRLWHVILLHAGFNAAALLIPAWIISQVAVLPVVVILTASTVAVLWSLRPAAVQKPHIAESTV